MKLSTIKIPVEIKVSMSPQLERATANEHKVEDNKELFLQLVSFSGSGIVKKGGHENPSKLY